MELEQLILVIDTARNLEGLRQDMRANATEYKTKLLRGVSIENVKTLILANNVQYHKRLNWILDLYTNHQTAFGNALTSIGITLASTIATYNELKAIADATDTADLSTTAKIQSAADYVLATLPAHLTVW